MIVVPSRLPTAPTAKATTIETTPTTKVAEALAPITRPRLGTSVNVVRPLRWLHSLVTPRIATIGRITDIGRPIAAAKLSKVTALSGAKMRTAPVAMTERTPMLTSIQKPERVSNILRSSILTSRVVEMGPAVRRAGAASTLSGEVIMVVMPQLLHVGCRR